MIRFRSLTISLMGQVQPPSLYVSKTRIDKALSNSIWSHSWPCLEWGIRPHDILKSSLSIWIKLLCDPVARVPNQCSDARASSICHAFLADSNPAISFTPCNEHFKNLHSVMPKVLKRMSTGNLWLWNSQPELWLKLMNSSYKLPSTFPKHIYVSLGIAKYGACFALMISPYKYIAFNLFQSFPHPQFCFI